jgi:cation-transporting P-type ATPase 13A2
MEKVPWHTIILRALDLITIVVPPALPATLSIGTSFAISRLRAAGIFCISPNRVNVAGKVNVVCFDKTGTLTEDGLDILGVRALERDGRSFREVANDILDIPTSLDKANLLHAMATCHSLKIVDGEVMGDPLDAKMFEFTGWTLEESTTTVPLKKGNAGEGTSTQTAPLVQNIVRPPGTRRFTLDDALKGDKVRAYFGSTELMANSTQRTHFLELGVIRTFEFVSALRRMTVITKRLKSKSMEIYLKGAPEILRDVCDASSCKWALQTLRQSSNIIFSSSC